LPIDSLDDFNPARVVAAITRNAGFSGRQMKTLKNLRVIAVHGVGYDPVDVETATQLGVAVTNTPGTNERSVAELAIALMFALAKQVVAADAAAREGDFGFKYSADLTEIAGLTLGILGFGAIGRQTAAIGRALGMRVVALSKHQPDAVFERLGVVRASSLQTLLSDSDVVSLHLPATPSTRNLIGREELALMKPTSLLINTGRGSTVDEDALVDALREGRIRGAGLDVFRSEPLDPNHPLCSLQNVILSPHLAGSTEAALRRTAIASAECVLAVLADKRPETLVNPQVWPSRRQSLLIP
jgi:D-3-phosphoglycerate dehydrogenase